MANALEQHGVYTRHDGCRENADLRLLHGEAISALCKTRVKPTPETPVPQAPQILCKTRVKPQL